MGPVKSFSLSQSDSRFTRRPNSLGMGPVKSFQLRYSVRRLTRLPSSAGIGPVKSFSLRSSASRFASRPNAGGIDPVSAFSTHCCEVESHRLPRFSICRRAKSPSAAGIGPVNPLPGSTSLVTRPAAAVDTPNHSPSGADVFQLVLSVQPGPPVAS